MNKNKKIIIKKNFQKINESLVKYRQPKLLQKCYKNVKKPKKRCNIKVKQM